MGNTKNDYDKHIEAFEKHFSAIYGDGWEELTMAELIKLLAKQTLGLNGGPTDMMHEAAEKVGFSKDNVVPVGDGAYQVLTMIEFQNEMDTVH